MGLCKPNRNRRAHLRGPLSSYLNKVVEKENPYPNASQSFLIETLASTFWTYKFKKQKKEILLRHLFAIGLCAKQYSGTNNWRSYWCFYVKLLQIDYNNQKDCCGVRNILGFVQRSQSCSGIFAKKTITYWDSCKGEGFYKIKSNWELK